MRLALTFDDGPSEWTEPLLDVLAAEGVRATFFVLGRNIAGRETTLRRTAADGHQIGNHTWSHLELGDCDAEEISREIDETTRQIEAVIGRPPAVFRAPYDRPGERAKSIAESRNLAYAPCDVIPRDWEEGTGAEMIAERVLTEAAAGKIVLLHDGTPGPASSARTDCTPTVDAVRLLLPTLRADGYELVTVSELFAAAT